MVSLIGAFLNRSEALPFARMTIGNFPSPAPRGTRAGLGAMEQIGTVFGIVNRTAEAASSVEWKLYRKRTDGRRTYAYEGMDSRQEVTQHLALKVWNRPNAFFTQQELVEVYAQHMLLTGEAWWHLPKPDGFAAPVEIWPVRPDRMTILESALTYLSGYEYRAPDGQVVRLDPSEVIFSRRPDPLSDYRGVGPVQSVLAKIDSVRFSDEWNRNLFLNGAEPGGIVKVGHDMDDDEFRRMQFRWNEAHKGVENVGRVAFLDGEDMEWVERQPTQRDMQFAELQQLNTEQIREAFTFPKSMLGTTENVNRANAETGKYQFAENCLVPLLNRIKTVLNTEFLPMFGSMGEGVEFDYCDPTPPDRQTDINELTAKTNAVVTLVGAGADSEEACSFVGMPPLEFEKPEPPAPVAPPPVMPTTEEEPPEEVAA